MLIGVSRRGGWQTARGRVRRAPMALSQTYLKDMFFWSLINDVHIVAELGQSTSPRSRRHGKSVTPLLHHTIILPIRAFAHSMSRVKNLCGDASNQIFRGESHLFSVGDQSQQTEHD